MSQAAPAVEAPFPPARTGWLVVILLMLAYIVSFIDRQIMALLIQPIKFDLNLSDTSVSLLIGLAFGVFYAVMGIPLGRLADSTSRRTLIAVAIVIWCIMTVACGMSDTYWQLFLARVGVGIGEAALAPAALSLISDYFPRETRARAISVYNAGVSIGAAIAFIVGGRLIGYVNSAPPVVLPLVGEMRPWQTVFLWVGLPGLFIAAAMFAIREPERRGKMPIVGLRPDDAMPFSMVVSYLKTRWRSFGSHFVGMSVVTILGYAYFAWLPTTFMRTWSWTIPQITLIYGLMLLTLAPLGVVLGGWYADWLFRNGRKDAHMRATLFGCVALFVPWQTIAPLMPTPELFLIVLSPAVVGGAWVTATGVSALMMICPNQMRGQTTAVYYLVISLLGLTVGPSAVAVATDYLFRDEAMLRYSLALVCGLGGALGIAVLSYNLRHFRDSMVEAEQWAGKPAF
jgi:MFS family permease